MPLPELLLHGLQHQPPLVILWQQRQGRLGPPNLGQQGLGVLLNGAQELAPNGERLLPAAVRVRHKPLRALLGQQGTARKC